MTNVIKLEPNKKPKRTKKIKSCKKCSKSFRGNTNQTICNTCKPYTTMFNDKRGIWLLNAIPLTGFNECISGVNLADLFKLKTLCNKYSQHSAIEVFTDGIPKIHRSMVHQLDLAHLYPAKGEGGYVGTLNPNNLLICPRKINQKMGNSVFGVGEKVMGLTPIPKGEAALKRMILEEADLTGLNLLSFTSRSGSNKPFPSSMIEYSLFDILKSETTRLGLAYVAEDPFDYYYYPDDYLTPEGAFELILKGQFPKEGIIYIHTGVDVEGELWESA